MQQYVSNIQYRAMAALLVFALIGSVVLSVLAVPVRPASAQTQPVWRVDAQGNITKDGVIFRVKGGSWFGLEGRHDLPIMKSLAAYW